MSVKTRLLDVYNSATDVEKEQGRSWYREARAHARAISVSSGVSLHRVVGLLAALSPRCRWNENIRRARDAAHGRPVASFGFAKRKVAEILAGTAPSDVLRGPKERAFYRAILGDETSVTVDTHCWKAAGYQGSRVTDYAGVASAYAAAATAVQESPRDFQAIVWVAWRNGAQRPLF